MNALPPDPDGSELFPAAIRGLDTAVFCAATMAVAAEPVKAEPNVHVIAIRAVLLGFLIGSRHDVTPPSAHTAAITTSLERLVGPRANPVTSFLSAWILALAESLRAENDLHTLAAAIAELASDPLAAELAAPGELGQVAASLDSDEPAVVKALAIRAAAEDETAARSFALGLVIPWLQRTYTPQLAAHLAADTVRASADAPLSAAVAACLDEIGSIVCHPDSIY